MASRRGTAENLAAERTVECAANGRAQDSECRVRWCWLRRWHATRESDERLERPERGHSHGPVQVEQLRDRRKRNLHIERVPWEKDRPELRAPPPRPPTLPHR